MLRVYTAGNLMDGQLVLDLLRANGISCQLFNQNASSGLGELPVTHPEVWILRDADLANARRAIQQFEQTPASHLDAACPRCAAQNPPNFEVCWQCDAILE